MSEFATWSLADMPDLSGRTVLVTGVTSGIGTPTARELLRAGARVILAARSETKLDQTAGELVAAVPKADTERLIVDLSDLTSVREAAGRAAAFGPIDVLINNAGVMATPYRRTNDGLELQMATNHFGPFLLTGLLLPQLVASGDGRIVSVASNGHRMARRAPLEDPRKAEGRYDRWPTYARTKLANLLFIAEAQRRLTAAGLPVKAMAAHPGYASTKLMSTGMAGGETGRRARMSIFDVAMSIASQSADDGALPTLMAATADLAGNTYCGPSNFGQMRGLPRRVGRSALAKDTAAAMRLWQLSEEIVGLRWP
ncbi:oxidoreductase [Nocardioides limicola]|uniref:oxidoreductase n=1 Tax=Nocardioides limicola TaxID=2803368 RepID=UPI0027DE8108|nr:oxidoreductase [Nocardioides sp. DJM-14]